MRENKLLSVLHSLQLHRSFVAERAHIRSAGKVAGGGVAESNDAAGAW